MTLKKISLSLIALFFFTSCYSQMYYSTKKKKCIKLFEKALNAPNKNINNETGMPDYESGLCLLKKALKKDPKFWEAHLLSAEYEGLLKNYNKVADHYKAAIKINPNHFSTYQMELIYTNYFF